MAFHPTKTRKFAFHFAIYRYTDILTRINLLTASPLVPEKLKPSHFVHAVIIYPDIYGETLSQKSKFPDLA